MLFGDVQIGQSAVEQFQLSGLQLQNNVALTITGTDSNCFSVSPKSLEPVAGALNDVTITLTYQPNAEAVQTARLEVVSPKTFPIFIDLKGGGLTHCRLGQRQNVYNLRSRRVVVLHADGGELVEIYDVMGQLLHIFNAVCGENRAEVGKNCVVLIKIRNKISKIVL